MFPTSFADDVVARFTEPGDWVLDPFAGRGTAVYSAAIADRHGVGIELNRVGWLYGATKLGVAARELVEARLREVEGATPARLSEIDPLPPFFTWCFSERVLAFLLAARSMLNWRTSKTDRTLMAFILVYLHGKRDAALSNQMRQTKAMAPRYAVNWWRERDLKPPARRPVASSSASGSRGATRVASLLWRRVTCFSVTARVVSTAWRRGGRNERSSPPRSCSPHRRTSA